MRAYLLSCLPPLRDVAPLMLETEMRPIEKFDLRREDVEIEKSLLRVTRSKTSASIRHVPLSEKTKSILKARIERFDGSLLFPQNDLDKAKPVKALNVFHWRAINNFGFNFRLYDGRHTFASRGLESGIALLRDGFSFRTC